MVIQKRSKHKIHNKRQQKQALAKCPENGGARDLFGRLMFYSSAQNTFSFWLTWHGTVCHFSSVIYCVLSQDSTVLSNMNILKFYISSSSCLQECFLTRMT